MARSKPSRSTPERPLDERPLHRACQRALTMVDIVDSATRSRMMSGIRGRNTKPEILIRSLLHRPGFSLSPGRARSARPPGHRAAALPRRSAGARLFLARPRLPSFQMAANAARVLARQDRPQSQQRRQGARRLCSLRAGASRWCGNARCVAPIAISKVCCSGSSSGCSSDAPASRSAAESGL